MADLTSKQKQLDIDKDGEIEASDLKALRSGAKPTKEARIREKLSKLVELMTQQELKEYQKNSKLNEADLNKNRAENIRDVFDDFYLITDNLITQHYGIADLSKFRDMYNLLFLKYQEKLNDILD
jgi:Skp family chaperone for outer membrane proteins